LIMSTHSYIGIENPNGTVNFIYSHFDGYPAYMKPVLEKHWDTRKRVESLMALGDIRALKRDPFHTELMEPMNSLPEASSFPNTSDFGEFAGSIAGSYFYLFIGIGVWRMWDKINNAWIPIPGNTP
jgi:hypothetical protein